MKDRIVKRFTQINKQIVSTKDMSKGCDQDVFLVKCEDGDYIYKESPKSQHKIAAGIHGNELARQAKIPSSVTVAQGNDYLIETCVKGEDLSVVGSSKKLHAELGRLLKKFHQFESPHWGEKDWRTAKTHSEYVHKYQDDAREKLLKSELFTDDEKLAIKTYFSNNESYLDNKTPVFIHGDPFDDNVMSDGKSITGIIDWGDLAGGIPEEDFACIYHDHAHDGLFEAAVEGYGGIDIQKIKYFCATRMTWMFVCHFYSEERVPEMKRQFMEIIRN